MLKKPVSFQKFLLPWYKTSIYIVKFKPNEGLMIDLTVMDSDFQTTTRKTYILQFLPEKIDG